MAEQTFRSPGFFEQEIDLSARKQSPTGTPAGIIGTAQRGPAFVPVTVGSFADFETKFGGLDPDRFGPYAVREFLKHRKAVTYMRVLGAGSNESLAEIQNTQALGIVKNAGFSVQTNDGVDTQMQDGAGSGLFMPTDLSADELQGGIQFLAAVHQIRPLEGEGFPSFTDSTSIDTTTGETGGGLGLARIIRASIMVASGSRIFVVDGDNPVTDYDGGGSSIGSGDIPPDTCTVDNDGIFKLVLSSSSGADFDVHRAADDSKTAVPGLRVFNASLNPSSPNYISKVLNTDPARFQEYEHVLWCDYAVEDELAVAGLKYPHATGETADNDGDEVEDSLSPITNGVAILRGSSGAAPGLSLPDVAKDAGGSLVGGQDQWRQVFGRFDTRYKTATTPMIISQPYGGTEYELFRFESLDDGAYPNDKFKVSIANLRASTDPNYDYGTFEVQIRRFSDTDFTKQIVEAYPECNLDPDSDRYIARQIGDYKASYDFDAEDPDERRLVISGAYPNRSAVVRVVMNPQIDNRDACLPKDLLPFGSKGVPVLLTGDHRDDTNGDGRLMAHDGAGTVDASADLCTAIVPPLPMRFKCTRGEISAGSNPLEERDSGFVGDLGVNEKADSRLYWGIKFERCPTVGEAGSKAALNTNISSHKNPLISAYAKFQGIAELGVLADGATADRLHNNKFTLARVALSDIHDQADITDSISQNVDGPASSHMKTAAYMRSIEINESTYTIADPISSNERMTLATLVHHNKIAFNRFSSWSKFTTMFYGGFDGLNILDSDVAKMNDRSSSIGTGTTDTGEEIIGKAASGFTDDGLVHALDAPAFPGDLSKDSNSHPPHNTSGAGKRNNVVASYRRAVEMMTDSMTVNTNILCIPGIRDSFVTDLAAERTREYSKAIYLMDIPHYDGNNARIFLDESTQSSKRADVQYTSETFEGRAVDNNYCATYFPDVWIDDPVNNLKVRVPASIAALASLAFNDKVAYPWFAPAGFNRGALEMVSNVTTRLTAGDRDTLYDSRINPIAIFPNAGFVIFGQKTLQMQKSALDRVNVRRMLLEVKRLVVSVANNILFEPNTPQTRARFVGAVTPLLALVQAQAGIESFQVVMDDTNNTIEDYESNRLNGRIVVVPTRAIEFIAIDFIITRSGVMFE